MQGVGSTESGGVLRYFEHFGLCRTTQQPGKETAKKYSRTTRTTIGLPVPPACLAIALAVAEALAKEEQA